MTDEIKVIDKRIESQPPVPRKSAVEYAMDKGAAIEVIERMWALQLEAEANEARKDYHMAMAAFKANAPEITKDRVVDFTTTKGQTKYPYATLANVSSAIAKAMAPHGLSATWKTEQGEGITVTCTIAHRNGHCESTSLTAAPDTTGNKNSIQAIGSTISYLERYTILALTGLATADMDDDGKNAEVEPITDEQIAEIEQLMISAGYNTPESIDKFLKWARVESVEAIPASELGRIKSGLNDAIKKRVK